MLYSSIYSPMQIQEDFCFGEGTICAVIRPGKVWQVRFEGVYWNARANAPREFCPGEVVRVIGTDGIMLLIEPLPEQAD